MATDPKTLLDNFVPHPVQANLDALTADVREALPHIVQAMRGIDDLFHKQMGPDVEKLFAGLAQQPEALRTAVAHYNGPYDKLNGGTSFVDGIDDALPQKGLYPSDITDEELDAHLAAHPEHKEALLDPCTILVRDAGELKAVPYIEHFRAELEPVAASLRTAADRVEHQGLKAFLEGRAAALLGEKPLRDSDADWVRLTDAPLEVVLGPYEVYEDSFRGLKAFYEGMLFAIDFEAGSRLKKIEASLNELAEVIPVPADAKPAVGGMAPLVVADEIIATGDGYAGLLAAAFNLPNDPWVRKEVGWKQVMIKNVMQAKFDACTTRIAKRVLAPAQNDDLSFEAYFYFILLHEVSHGLGPAYRADGRSTNEACGKHYTPFEEAKADVGSLVLLLEKNGQCGIPELSHANIAASYLAGLHRSARFGLHEAHGKANVVQYSFFRREGVITDAEGGTVAIDADKLPAAARQLLDKICTLQASGSEAELVAFLEDYGAPPKELVTAIEGLTDVPIDIRPIYSV